MKHILILILIFVSLQSKGQELWQLSPWATDSTYVLGALSSGEPTWVQINGIATRIDSMTYANDTLYVYTPDTTFKAEIVGGSGLPGSAATNRVAFGQSTDTLTYDSLFYFNPTNNFLGVGTGSPNGAGALGGIHVNSNFFTGVHLTNNQTGTTASDGTEFYIYGDTLYIANKENGKIELATNGASRMTITGAGRVGVNTANPSTTLHVTGETTISSLASGGGAPATSGTTVKVISDANGKLSFQTNNTGTVTSVGLTTGTTGTDVNVSGSPITSSGNITLNIPTASGSNTGKLSSTDWTTFNAKPGGSGSSGYLSYWSAGSTLASSPLYRLASNSVSLGTTTNTNLLGRSGLNIMDTDPAIVLGKSTTQYWYHYLSGNNYEIYNPNYGAVALFKTTGKLQLGSLSGSGNRYLYATSTGEITASTYDAASTTGTGTTGYIPRYFSAYVMDRTGLYCSADLGYQIGLGTTSPSTYLQNGSSKGISIHDASNDPRFSMSNATRTWLWYMSGNDMSFWNSSGGDLIRFDDAGRLGIITTSPQRTFHVQGEARITDLTTDTPTGVVGADADGDLGTVSTGNGVTLSSGALGLTGQALAVHNLGTNGLIARTGAGTVAARTITAGDGISITDGDGVSGNPTIIANSTSYGQLYNTGNLTGQTWDGSAYELDFTASLSSSMTVSTANNSITIPATGTYRVTYSGTYGTSSTYVGTLYFHTYLNGSDMGYLGICRTRSQVAEVDNLTDFHRTYLVDLTASDVLELYYDPTSLGPTTVSFYNLVFTVERIK